MSFAVVAGNPKPASRTLAAATHVVRELTGAPPDLVVDLATLGPALLDWADPEVTRLVEEVGDADLVVVASPTYKATYTGLLKLFLDRFAGGSGLRGLAVPLMLGAGPAHALAPEHTLRPVLTELGASVPYRGLFVLDREYDDPAAYASWLEAARPIVSSFLGGQLRHLTARPRAPLAPTAVQTNQDLDAARLRQAFGVFPTGVVAVAAEVEGALVGLAASSFTSVSLDPPLVSFSVARASKTWPDLRRADHLGVTILADHHDQVCSQLAGPVESRFDGLTVSVSDQGAVTLDDGLARFYCTLHDELEAGDHVIVLLELHAVDHADTSPPLIFHRSGFGRLAGTA